MNMDASAYAPAATHFADAPGLARVVVLQGCLVVAFAGPIGGDANWPNTMAASSHHGRWHG
jgi:hypothetical protein